MNIEEQKKCYLFKYLYNKYKGNKTQKDISIDLNITEKTIQNWLAARNKIARKNYVTILKYYNLPTNLFDEDILNTIIMNNNDEFMINEIVLNSLINKNEKHINNINKSKESTNITNSIKETIVNIGNLNNYSISYDDIKTETTDDIYKHILSIIKNDYKDHFINSSFEIINNQTEFEIALLYQELKYKIHLFFINEFIKTKINEKFNVIDTINQLNNQEEIKQLEDEIIEKTTLFYKGNINKTNNVFQSNYKNIISDICNEIQNL